MMEMYQYKEVFPFPQDVLFALVTGSLLYFALHLMIRSLRRIAQARNTPNIRETIKSNWIALAVSPVLLGIVYTLPSFSGKFYPVVITANAAVVITGGLRFVVHKTWQAGKDQQARMGGKAGWMCGLFTFAVLVIEIAALSPAAYRIDVLNTSAFADLCDAKRCLEAYHENHKKYPDSLEQAGCGEHSKYVKVMYAKTGPGKYRLTSLPESPGNKEYMAESDRDAVYWKPRNDAAAKWQAYVEPGKER